MRPATQADLPLLAEMNRQLILDEGSRNPMSAVQLQERMGGWVTGNWQIRIFELPETAQVVGYAVYQLRYDEYIPENKIVYLRQMFVIREVRRQGLGRSVFTRLLEEFPESCRVELDVLATNTEGQAFWSSVGFKPDYTHMRLEKQG